MDKKALAALASSYSGPITKVETGVSANLSPREWRNVVRSPSRVDIASGMTKEESDRQERLSERRVELAREFAFVRDHDAARETLSGKFDRNLLD